VKGTHTVTESIRVLIADDNKSVRRGIASLLSCENGRILTSGNSGAVVDAILHRTPVPPKQINPALTMELVHIINNALEKARNLRYQHAADIRTDLDRLKRETDSPRLAMLRHPDEYRISCYGSSRPHWSP
jgi:CheY-like chemotaxis protein